MDCYFEVDSVVFLDREGPEGTREHLLRTLISEGSAERISGGIAIPNERFLQLEPGELAHLDAPPVLPYSIQIGSEGDPSSARFRYSVSLRDPDGGSFPAGEFLGAGMDVGGIWHRLSPEQVELFQALKDFSEVPRQGISGSDLLAANLRPLGRIQSHAERAGAHLSRYLQEQQVILPDALTPDLDIRTDGSAKVSYEVGHLGEGGFTPALSGSEAERYSQRASRGTKRHHVVGRDGTRRTHLVHEEEVLDGIREVKELGELNAEEVDDFLENPHQYLSSRAFLLEDFSDRVTEIAELKYSTNPSFAPGKATFDWEKMAILLGGTAEGDVTQIDLSKPEVASAFLRAVDRAVAKERAKFIFRGHLLDTDDPAVREVAENLVDAQVLRGDREGDKAQAAASLEQAGIGEKSHSLALRIRDNLEDVDLETEVQAGAITAPRVPAGLLPTVTLFDYQLAGLGWLLGLSDGGAPGGLLADDMGLGKTLQVLSFLVRKVEEGDPGPFLIVAPVSLLENWRQEIERRFVPEHEANVVIAHGDFLARHRTRGVTVTGRDGKPVHLANKKALDEVATERLRRTRFVITNYETVRDYQFNFGEIRFSVMVCDEAQKIKNPTTHITNAIKAMKADLRIVSTATPVENSLIDLWSLVDFVAPGFLGSLREFRGQYAAGKEEIPPEDIAALRGRLDDRRLILRRTKETELPGLPKKTEYRERIPLSTEQIELYGRYATFANTEPEQVLGAIGRLISVCSHPLAAVEGDPDTADVRELVASAPKLEWALEKLGGIRQAREKCLVFTRLRSVQKILAAAIAAHFGSDAPISILNGTTPPTRRQAVVDRFNSQQGFAILILSPEAAGVGLNIVGANHVIHYTRLWNPAKEDQATDRVYRIGQERPVHVYYPISVFPDGVTEDPTIEERIDQLLGTKRGVSRDFLVPQEGMDIGRDLMSLVSSK